MEGRGQLAGAGSLSHHVGSRDQTEPVRFDSKYRSLVRHLAGLKQGVIIPG